ncbi:MAG: HEAT repeat domain-containing protein, partial [Planctomycetia bacterium]
FEMKPKGAGMEMSDSHKLVWGIGATDVEYSWAGKIHITDFIGGWLAHPGGRLLSLDAGEKTWRAAEAADSARLVKEGFAQRDSAELTKLLSHPDARIRLRAQISLTRKPDALQRLTAATASADFITRIHGIWGLGILARREQASAPLIALLNDANPEIRAQVLRVLADAKLLDPAAIPIERLLADASPRVRFFASILAGKHKIAAAFVPVCAMLHENNNSDAYLRHAGIFALQHIAVSPAVLTALSTTYDSPAVRLAAVVALRRMKDPGVASFIRDPDPQVADEAIRAICDSDKTALRPAVAALLDELPAHSWSPFMLRRLIHNAYRIGTLENAARLLKVAADPQLPDTVRKESLRLLAVWTQPFPVDQLTGHWNPLPERSADTIRPALSAALPQLLAQQNFVLTAALEMVGQYHLDVPSLDDVSLQKIITDRSL